MKAIKFKLLCLVVSLVLAASLAGCNGDGNTGETQGNSEAELLVADAVLEESRYRLGDKMGDYTVTDVNGVSYTFSQLLQEKKAIVLNFWYLNCGPCKIEFPYLEEAYRNYQNDIEVLAINCIDGTDAEIKAFADENGLTFPMAKGDFAWESAVGVMGYPTTIVIDRYGYVAMSHTGYIDNTETFNSIFGFFTADDYTQTTVNNISEIL